MDILTRNNVRDLGEGTTPLILAHGFACDQQIWEPLLQHLLPHYRVIAFDYTGCGHSDIGAWEAKLYRTLNGYVRDLLGVCDALELEQPIVFGHSISGTIAMLAAAQQPERFRQVITLGSSPCYLNKTGYSGGFSKKEIWDLLQMMEDDYRGWAGYVAPVAMENSDRPELAEILRQSFLMSDPRVARIFAEATLYCDIRSQLPSVTVPTDLLQSSHDAFVPPEAAQHLHDQLPDSRLHELDAHGHYPHVSDPAGIANIIQQCIRARARH